MKTTLPLSALLVLLFSACAAPQAQEAPTPEVEYFPFQGSAPLSEAVRVGDMMYLSGKLGIGQDMPRGIESETRQTMENIKASLEAKGMSMSDVVKCTVFLVDMADYGPMNAIYREYWPENPPARSAVGVASLVADAVIEIECMAAIGS
jgi:reactive intermediate/imine deaminase